MRELTALIASIFLLIVVGYFIFLAEKVDEFAYRPIDIGGGSIMVDNQDDLNKVILSVELVEPGFVAIHESMSGAPARLMGSSEYLEAGFYEDLEIILNTPMLPGFRYISILMFDQNKNQIFDLGVDLPVEVDGQVVRPDFVAQPE